MGKIFRFLVGAIYEMVEVFVISASFFLVVYIFLVQPHQVKGSSMFPTFKDGQYLLTDKVTFKRRLPKYGDVVVFKAPINENYDFIKRVLAVAGDQIMIKGGKIYINGNILNEYLTEGAYLPTEYVTQAGQFLHEGQVYTVPDGAIMAIGDNRNHSSDSRDWGPVPLENIVGRAMFQYWPPDSMGFITNPVDK